MLSNARVAVEGLSLKGEESADANLLTMVDMEDELSPVLHSPMAPNMELPFRSDERSDGVSSEIIMKLKMTISGGMNQSHSSASNMN